MAKKERAMSEWGNDPSLLCDPILRHAKDSVSIRGQDRMSAGEFWKGFQNGVVLVRFLLL